MESLQTSMKEAIRRMYATGVKEITLLHHNDTDGLASCAILRTCFSDAKFSVKAVALEKTYPSILEEVLKQRDGIVVFADFGSRIAPEIAKMNAGRNMVVILDHHKPSMDSTKSTVEVLNGELHGLRGDRDITASTTCWLFAQEMNARFRFFLAHLAVLGGVGDAFYVDNQLYGVNAVAVQAAVEAKTLVVQEKEGYPHDYILECFEKPISCATLAKMLDTLGAVGFYEGGAEMGVQVCLDGPTQKTDSLAARLRKVQEEKFEMVMETLRKGGLQTTKSIQWFHVGDAFSPMGVKAIGVFLERLKKDTTGLIDPDLYLAGFQNVPSVKIPGCGIPGGGVAQVKISMRLPSGITAAVEKGEALPLNVLLPEATLTVGGFADACHVQAAAVVVDKGQEEELVKAMAKISQGGHGCGVGYGFGKCIIAGGQFLLWGVKACVGAMAYRTTCTVERCRADPPPACGWVLADNRIEVEGYKKKKKAMQVKSISEELLAMGIDLKKNPVKITLGGDLIAASGDGASAAGCVALAKAVNHAFGLKKTLMEINHFAWIGEHAYHGAPSGVDNTVSTFGGVIEIQFWREEKRSEFRSLVVPRPLYVVLGHSGTHFDTSQLYPFTVKKREQDPAAFDADLELIKQHQAAAVKAIESGKLRELGSIMSENHVVLDRLGVSHPRLVELCKIAMEHGAWGAKLTGGGMGGFMCALVDGEEGQRKVAQALTAHGCPQVMLAVLGR